MKKTKINKKYQYTTNKNKKENYNKYLINYDYNMNNIEKKIILKIYEFLDPKEIIIISEVNKTWYEASFEIPEFNYKNILTNFHINRLPKLITISQRSLIKTRIICLKRIKESLINFIKQIESLEKNKDVEHFKEMIGYNETTKPEKMEIIKALLKEIENIEHEKQVEENWYDDELENYFNNDLKIVYSMYLFEVYIEITIIQTRNTKVKCYWDEEESGEELLISFIKNKFNKLEI
jgi:hypothetical protein